MKNPKRNLRNFLISDGKLFQRSYLQNTKIPFYFESASGNLNCYSSWIWLLEQAQPDARFQPLSAQAPCRQTWCFTVSTEKERFFGAL